MLRSSERLLERALRGLALGLSILFVLLFLLIAWRRMHYPFEVDRLENPMLTSVWRLRQGSTLYCAPSLQWAPFLYAPLFFYVSAAVTRLVGIHYAALRLVSTLSTIGSFCTIFALVWTETRRFAAALFAVGVFASLYAFVLGWYDVGRVDSLSLFLFLIALLATRRTHPLLASIFWVLAFLAKQTFLPLGLAIFLMEWRRPTRMITGMLSFAVLAGGSVAWLNHASHGWFTYYAFGTPGVLKWSFHTAVMYPFADLIAPLPIAAALVLLAALFTNLRWRERDGTYLAIVSLLVFAAIGYVRAHVGANLNAVIPAYAWMAVLTGIALDRLLRLTLVLPQGEALSGSGTAALPASLWLFATVQLAAHLYRPAEIPTGNLAARQQFLAALRATPGDVWVVDHSYDGILAGKPLHADMDALDAVLGRHDAPTLADFRQKVEGHQFAAVVLDHDAAGYQPEGIFTAPPFSNMYAMRVVAPGAMAPGDFDQPQQVLLPCDTPSGPEGSLADLHAGIVDRSRCATR